MNFTKHKSIVTFIVLIVAVGLIAVYFPLLAPTSPPPPDESNQALVSEPVLTPEDSAFSTTTTSTNKDAATQLPEGFSGLEEESKSFNNLLDDLNQ